MRSIDQLLSELRALDVKLWVDGERLRYDAPPNALSPDLRADLIENKAELVSMLRHLSAQETTIAPRKHGEDAPLSFAQQRLWFLDQSGDGAASFFFICAALRLTGVLNIPVLQRTLQTVINRHEVLRTVAFDTLNDETVQTIAPELKLRFPMTDLCELPDRMREQEIHRLVQENIRAGFDLTHGPFVRLALLKLGEKKHVFLMNTHQIVSDAWSFQILVKEIMAGYAAGIEGRPNPLLLPMLQYADYAVWHRTWLESEASRQQIAFWRRQLAGLPPFLTLPTDFPRAAARTFAGRSYDFMIHAELAKRLEVLSRASGATLFMTLAAAFAALLSRRSGQTDLAVGTPVANRTRHEVENLIGFFVNTLVLRADLRHNPTFNELLGRMKRTCLEAYAHQEVPFEYLLEEIKPTRVLSYSPLFQVMFVLQKSKQADLKLPGLRIESLEIEQTLAKCDLLLKITESADALPCSFEYNTDLFRRKTVQHMARDFTALLEEIVADPEKPMTMLFPPCEADKSEGQALFAPENRTPAGIQNILNPSCDADSSPKPLSPSGNLMLLRKGMRDDKNLFFIHDGSGDVGGYSEWCGSLDAAFHYWGIGMIKEQKYYPRKLSIPKLSKRYIENISEIQPHAPYYLAGWSVGGSIAFEIARQLEQMHCRIGLLILLDSPPPAPRPEPQNDPFDVQTEKEIIQASLNSNAFRDKIADITTLDELWTAVVRHCETNHSKTLLLDALKNNTFQEMRHLLAHYEHLDGKEIIYYFNTLRSFSHARDMYVPQSKLNAEVHFLKAEHSSRANERGWNLYCRKPVNIHLVKGDHFTMFHPHRRTRLIHQLNSILEKS